MRAADFSAVFPPRAARPDRPGAAAIVTKRGETLLRAAYGAADMERGFALDPSMTFRIGSLTKQFTAVAILMLADDGDLALDDTIGAHLSDYPSHAAHLTIEHLLTHSSGIRGYTEMREFPSVMTKDVAVAQLIDFFKKEPLSFVPGTRFAYSNSGYVLLGAIIERVSGLPYADFLAQKIFKPLGLSNTAYEGHERSAAVRAVGYNRDRPAPTISMSWPYAAGGLVSTLDDLARWDRALTKGVLLSKESWVRATTPYRFRNGKRGPYAYGFVCGRLAGRDTLEHGGGIPGFSSHALSIPQDELFVAVLSNDDRMNIVSLLTSLFRRDDAASLARKLARYGLVTSN